MGNSKNYQFAKSIKSGSSINPITPIGSGASGSALQYPMQRYIQYTERDWRYCADQMINSSFGMPWAQIVTWMVSADPFIQNLIFKRLAPITSLRFVIQDEESVTNEELTKFLKDRWFHQLIEAIMMAIFQGFSGIQIDLKANHVTSYPLELLDYKKKALKFAFYELSGSTVFNNYSNMAWFEYNKSHQTALGLYQPMTLEYISMSTTNQNWVGFTTNTAFPTRQVYYMSGNEATDYLRDAQGNKIIDPITGQPETKKYNQLRDWSFKFAKENNPNSVVALPMSYDQSNGEIIKQVHIEDSQIGAHTGTAYKACMDRITLGQERLSLLVLGSVLTSLPGSSRALGEVHERQSDKVIESDRKWVLDCLNDVIYPKLNFPEGFKFAIDDSESITLEEALQYSDIAQKNSKKISDEFFSHIGLPSNYITEAEPEEEEVEVKEEVVKKVKEKKPKKGKTGLSAVYQNIKSLFGQEEKEEWEEVDVVETITKKEIIKKPIPKERLNFKNYNLNSCEELMRISSKADLFEPSKKEFEEYFICLNMDKRKGLYLKDQTGNKVILNDIAHKVDKIGFNLFKETLSTADEVWKVKNKLSYLKYYNNVTYQVTTENGELTSAKCLRSYKDVEQVRKGELCNK